MDYSTLFIDGNRVEIGSNICCTFWSAGSTKGFSVESSFPIVFVLQGRLTIHSPMDNTRYVQAGHWLVCNAAAIADYQFDPSSIVLVFSPPERLSLYLKMTNRTFGLSASKILPFSSSLQRWIENVLTKHSSGDSAGDENVAVYCQQLVRLILLYPRLSLDAVYVPFMACSMGDCDRCKER